MIDQLQQDVDRLTAAHARLEPFESYVGIEASIEAHRVRDLRRELEAELRKARLRLAQAQKRKAHHITT